MIRPTLLLVLCAILLAGAPAAAHAGLPPLIDRDLFFGDPEISGAQLSPDGLHMSFIKPYKDVRNIWVKKLEEPFDAARPVTADERPVPGYFWSQDGKFLLYVQDKGGNENWHVYAVDPLADPEGDTGVPPARNLTPVEGARASIYAVPESDPNTIVVGLNDRDPMYSDAYRVNIATGERSLLIENTQKVGQYVFDNDGDVKLAYRQTEDGGAEILRVDGDQLTPIYTATYLEQAYPINFTKDGEQAYMTTNVGADVDLARLVMLDVATGETRVLEEDPLNQVDFGGAIFDEQTEELMATYYIGDKQRIYPRTKRAEEDLKRIQEKLPPGNIGLGSSTEDMRYSLVSVSSDTEPGATYLYDREAGTFTLQYRIKPELERKHLAEMTPVKYKARDGMTIPAYLTLPKGVDPKNLPVILHPHGGPWARDNWGYSPYPQFLANRGYAVLQPNFRSSTGYGKKFLNAGNHEWGTGAMQHDLTDAVKYLIDEGIADPERICIFGGSYGGYATLAGVTFTPDLYACAIPYVAPSSLITLIESFPAYWRPFLKGSWYMRVGDPADPEDRADLDKRSPINYIDRINVPMLVVHGANDPRVKQAESDAIVEALHNKGHAVEYVVAPDEGHGFRAPMNNKALAVAMERFLAKHLGGRAQEDVSPELAAHLASLTVDPAGVKAGGGADPMLAETAKTAPLPSADGAALAPGRWEYVFNYEMGGQAMTVPVIRIVEEAEHSGTKCWGIQDTANMQMGTQVDRYLVDRGSLRPLRRESTGMGTITIDYGDTGITGEMAFGGQTQSIDEALAAPAIGDGPGFEIFVSGLPLAAGYETTFRMHEVMVQKVRPFHLRVAGEESVTVPAGTFDAFVVELMPLDGDAATTATLHVLKSAPHVIVRSAYKLPAMMGGGMMKGELVSSGAAAGSGSE